MFSLANMPFGLPEKFLSFVQLKFNSESKLSFIINALTNPLDGSSQHLLIPFPLYPMIDRIRISQISLLPNMVSHINHGRRYSYTSIELMAAKYKRDQPTSLAVESQDFHTCVSHIFRRNTFWQKLHYFISSYSDIVASNLN